MFFKNKKPLLLLDIDGVIAPTGYVEGLKHRGQKIPYSSWHVTDDTAHFFAKVSQQVELVWMSNWEEYSLLLGKELGIESKKYLSFDMTSSDIQWYKSEPVQKIILAQSKKRKIIIIDDEISDNMISWADDSSYEILVIKPDSDKGVSAQEQEEIKLFLK